MLNIVPSTINPVILGILGLWEIVWKAIACWKAARNSQKIWFVVILVINTIGILPIIYLLFFRKKKIAATGVKAIPKKMKKKKRR